MVNHIDNTKRNQAVSNRERGREDMLEKIRQQKTRETSSQRLGDQEQQLLKEYQSLKVRMKASVNTEINGKRKRVKSGEQDEVPVLSVQHFIKLDPKVVVRSEPEATGQKKVTGNDLQLAQLKIHEQSKLEALELHARIEASNLKLELNHNMVREAQAQESLITDKAFQHDVMENIFQHEKSREQNNIELQNAELQAVVLHSDRTQERKATEQEWLNSSVKLMMPKAEGEPKAVAASDRQLNYSFKSWQGDPSVNIVMQGEATIAQTSDDRVQRALREHQSEWQQNKPLIITPQDSHQEKGQNPHRPVYDENGDDE